jgi:hypothetical protein
MSRNSYRLFFIIALSLTIGACDDFSLFDQFQNTGGLSLTLQRNVVEQDESIALYPAGGTQPYSYAVMENDLFYAGDTPSHASNENNTFHAGNSIGRVTIRLSDADGHSIDNYVTIRPRAVHNFSVNSTVSNTIAVSWTYPPPPPIIRFRIERSIEGAAFQVIASPGSGETTYTDKGLNPDKTYTYRMYAVADEYLSKASAERSDQPNS